MGGSSPSARRRGVRLGDGWIEGAPVDIGGAERLVQRLHADLSAQGRDPATFEVIVPYSGERTPQHYRRLEQAGVSAVFCPGFGTDPTRPLADRVAQMERFSAEIIEHM